MMIKLRFTGFLALVFTAGVACAQAPNISYPTPQVFTLNTAISPISPTNTGGAVIRQISLNAAETDPRGLAVDASGNVYVANNGTSAIDKIPAGGGAAVSLSSGFSSPTGIAVDATGNVFVADYGNTAIKEIPANGGPTIALAGGYSFYGVAVDASGNLFVSDFNDNTVDEIKAGGNTIVTIASGFSNPCGLTVDAAGNVFVADRSNNVVKKITPGGTVSTVGSGFNNPIDVVVDSKGNLYVADRDNDEITEIPAAGDANTVIYNVPALEPGGIAIGTSGNLFVSSDGATPGSIFEVLNPGGYTIMPQLPAGLSFDTNSGTISGTPTISSPATKYTVTAYNASSKGSTIINITTKQASGPVISYASPQLYNTLQPITPLAPISSGVGTMLYTLPAIVASGINNAIGIAVDALGNTYVADAAANAVYKIAAGSTTATPVSGSFSQPAGVALDNAGNLYVANFGSGAIIEVPAAGGADITLASDVNGPYGIAVDASHNIYCSVRFSNLVEKIAAGSNAVTTLASGFNFPAGVAVDAYGNVYVADRGNNRIEKILASNDSIVNLGVASGEPNGVAVSNAGDVFYADLSGNSIVDIPASGSRITVASGLGGPAGLVLAADNSIYFTGTSTADIEKITRVGGYAISPALPAGLLFNSKTGVISGQSIAVSPATTYTVTAYATSGNTSTSLNISVTNGSANLAALTLSRGSLSPAFASGTNTYTNVVTNGTSSLTVTPTASNTKATITVNGAAVTSGKASLATPLAVGSNTITIVVTGVGGATPNTYTVTVIRPSTNAKLSGLTISAGTLSPAFTPNTTSYTTTVPYTSSPITVTPAAAVAGSTVTVNGTAVGQGSTSAPIALSVGSNTINVAVTAQDGVTISNYTITVTRLPSGNDMLSNIVPNKGVLSPSFTPGSTAYSVMVTNGTTSLTLTPTSADGTATIAVNGTNVASGKASAALPLVVGQNTFTIKVTAQDNVATQNYTVTVIRPSTNAKLSALSISSGGLTPSFTSATLAYTVSVPNAISSVTLTPTVAVAGATVNINGTTVSTATASGAIALAVGANAINVVVTAQDGVTTITYTVTVTRAKSSNSALADIDLSNAALSPAFAATTTNYTATVAPGTTGTTITPTVADIAASVTVNGTIVTSGTPSGTIALALGANVVTLNVTAQDGTTTTYTVTVTRPASTNTGLSNLLISKGTLSPAFAAATTHYTDMVTNGTASVTVTPTTADVNATLTVNGVATITGKPSGAISLGVGYNLITIVVTAEDGTTTATTSVTVLRPSTNAKLSALIISNGVLTPTFNSGVASYSASVTNDVSSITVTPTVVVQGSTVKVNGTMVTSGSPSTSIALNVGSNTVATVVTAQDGTTTTTYTITITRAAADANIPDAEVSVQTPTEKPSFDDDALVVHQAISPNGDGINDFLQIDNISQYPDNNLKIMNRNGQLVFEAKGYDNATKAFDGHSNKNGQMQLPGTYFYSLDYTIGGVVKHKAGFLVLKY